MKTMKILRPFSSKKPKPPIIQIDRALLDDNLLGAALGNKQSWSRWISILRATFALPMTDQDRENFREVSGNRDVPEEGVKELWATVGRRSGKSRIAAALSVYVAAFSRHKLAKGEKGVVLVLAASQTQSRTVFDYCLGFLATSPILKHEIDSSTATEIRLKNGVVIAVHANSYRTIRGKTLLACIFDEVAFWRSEESALPDLETYRAVMPSLATTNGMLIGISSPYRRIGLLHQKHRDYFGQSDPDVLVVQGASKLFNPTLDEAIINRAKRDDPEAALAEWDAEFRSDIAAFLDDAIIDACIDNSRPMEISPHAGTNYKAFVDPSGGRHDAFTLGIGHKVGDCFIIDVLRGRYPPFDPSAVVEEYAAIVKAYKIGTVVGDNYAGEWCASEFRKHNLTFRRSEKNKSDLYVEALPWFMRCAISIPDHPKLIRELRLLERRTSRTGKDLVDHGRGGSDDHANAVVGALHACTLTGNYDPYLRWVATPNNDAEAKARECREWQRRRLQVYLTGGRCDLF